MHSQIEYILLACEYENTKQAESVRNKLLSCEYATTQYNALDDYEFWNDHSVYQYKGPIKQLETLNMIHNSELSIKTTTLFIDSLEYATIRDNNWGRNSGKSNIPNTLDSYQDLGNAREKFRKDRNSALKKLYEIFEFTNSLTTILTSNYIPETYDPLLSLSYRFSKLEHSTLKNKSNNLQKSIKNE